MVKSYQNKALAACFIALAQTFSVNSFWIFGHNQLLAARIDPIVNPGAVATHMHNFVGSSIISKNYNYNDQLKGNCSTASVQQDQSSYWQPSLYSYNSKDKSFSAIPIMSVKTYYLQRPGPKNDKLQAFPPGLVMLAGNPNRRVYNSTNRADQAISYMCLDFKTSHKGDRSWDERQDFFNHTCPDGLRAQVFFPSCGDGRLDSPDHQSHLAYPIENYNTGRCPSTHPIHYISLFYEFIYAVQNFPFDTTPGAINWVLSNGDTTGLGLHADFVNGWPVNLLQTAIDDPTCVAAQGNVNDCATLAPLQNFEAAAACEPQKDQPAEPEGDVTPLKALPGCNPLWTGTGPKPSCTSAVADPSFVKLSSTIPANWGSLGCIKENGAGRALTGPKYISNNNTVSGCINFCSSMGMPVAGMEYGKECYCGDSFTLGTKNSTVMWSKCGVDCPGNKYETCGGESHLNVYQNFAVKPKTIGNPDVLTNGWVSGGCVLEPTSGRALTGYRLVSKNMTNELCSSTCASKGFTIAGTEFAQECYCGNSFANGGGSSDTVTNCNMPCSGTDNGTLCGAGGRLSIYTGNSTVPATVLPAGWTAKGCYVDLSPNRVLNSFSTTSDKMTIDSCTATCNQKGFAFAGLEYGRECYCGNSLNGAATANSTDCSMTCAGQDGTFCGAGKRLNIFSGPINKSRRRALH